MSGYIFNHADLQNYFNSNDYEGLKTAIDNSFANITTICRNPAGTEVNIDGSICGSGDTGGIIGYNSTVDIPFIQDVYTFSSFLKNENRTKIDELNTTLNTIKEKKNNIDFELKNDNVKKIKNRVSQNKKQSSENIKAFLETYLYLIIKIIFIFILFVLVYNYSGISFFAFSFSELYGNLKNKFNEVKNSGSEIQNKLNNKIEKIKENRGNKEKPKSNILNNFNNENYVEEMPKPKTPNLETSNFGNYRSNQQNPLSPSA